MSYLQLITSENKANCLLDHSKMYLVTLSLIKSLNFNIADKMKEK